MPNYTSVSTEDMNGTPVHTFTDASGMSSPPLYGPEADALASSVSSMQSMAPQAPPPEPAPGGMSVAPEALPTGSNASFAPAPGYSQADANDAIAQRAAAAGQQQAAMAAHNAQLIQHAAAVGNLQAASASPEAAAAFINAPTHGTTRAQLQQRAQNSVAIPKSGEETIEQGAPYDSDAAEARANANLDLRLAKQQRADMMAERAQREADMLDQQAAIAAVKMQREQQKQQQIEDGVQQDYAHAREYRDQVAKQQVDPGRLFSGDKGALNTVLAVIGQGLGAFAAAGGGSPTINGRRAAAGGQNFAKQIIDSAIDRDIRAQEVNIRANNDAANNQLNDIYRRLGDMNQAKNVLRQMQQDYAGLQMKALAARDGSQDAQLGFQEWDAANAADRAEQERKFLADAYGKHTVKVAQQYAQPGGGGPPGYQEQLRRAQALAAMQGVGLEQQKNAAEIEQTRANTAKLQAEAAAGGPGAQQAQQKFNEGIQFVESGENALKTIVAKQGGRYNPATGQITWSGGDVPGSGVLSRATGLKGDDAKAIDAAVGVGAPAIEKGVEGDAAGEAGIATIKENLTSGDSNKRRAAAEALAQVLAGRRRSVESGAPAGARQVRSKNQLQSAIESQHGQQQAPTGGGVRAE